MGRFYDGDINGKFWFGIQDSQDADFFGVEGTANFLSYDFQMSDIPNIEEGINTCNEKLGKYKKKITKFFKNNDSYTDKKLADNIGLKDEKNKEYITKELLVWYARLELGEKILKCVKEQEYCSFEAEL